MAHTYDLVLQAATPGEAPPLDAFLAALKARGATLSDSGHGAWKLPEGEVSVSVLLEEGAKKGVDVRVPMKDSSTLLEAVALALVDIAAEAKGAVSDPQRAASVSHANLPAMVDEYLRLARYAGEYAGDGGSIGLTSYARPLDTDTGTAKWLGIVVVFVIALWVTWRVVTDLQTAALADEAPAEVDGATKIPGK